jgi:exosortase A-associated hydrolase 2
VTATGRPALQLFFLDPDRPSLFATAAVPAAAVANRGIVICPAFAEEMNRTRRTVRLFMERCAAAGIAAINVDLRGTGESAGEFADARWEDWLADLHRAADWLRGRGCDEISLLGVRAGALLAWQLASAPGARFERLLLWQPLLTGKAVITDMLRARVIAMSTTGTKETVNELREQLRAGSAVEAAGYRLTAPLAAALEAAAIATTAATAATGGGVVGWLEVVAEPEAPVRAAAENALAGLRAAGRRADLLRAQDPPFWATTETTTGAATVQASIAWLAAGA